MKAHFLCCKMVHFISEMDKQWESYRELNSRKFSINIGRRINFKLALTRKPYNKQGILSGFIKTTNTTYIPSFVQIRRGSPLNFC